MAEFDPRKPEYPDLLLPKTWDKKKSILSAKVKTGMGEVLKDAHDAYLTVHWKLLDLGLLMTGNTYNAVNWKGHFDDALAEAADVVMPVSRKLDLVVQQAKEAQALFTANKLSPKSDVKLAADVWFAANAPAGELHLNRLKPYLLGEYQMRLGMVATTVGILQKTGKSDLALFVQAVKVIRQDPSAAVFKTQQTEARKLTQTVGNIVRYSKQSCDFGADPKACQKLFDELDAWANGKVEWIAETTATVKKTELAKMVKAAQTAGQLFA